jgi:uncharacterized membrane protein
VSGPPDSLLFLGRFHPVLVHLPIGFILLVAVLEVCARLPRFKHANTNVGVILALAVPLAAFTALCGWLLSLAGGYDLQLLQWHKWNGIGTAIACAVVGMLYWFDLKKVYRWLLALTVVALAVASHFGGSLTHGSDYLVRYAPGPLRAWLGPAKPAPALATKPKDVNALPAFAGVVQPVLQQNCVACHGPEKSKGNLRLDSLAGLLAGGKSGKVIVAGKSGESDLIKRVHLSPEEDDHMPPDGKPQPSADDLALLEWWIDAGAPADKTVGELKPPASVSRVLAARFGAPAALVAQKKAIRPKPLNEVLTNAVQLADQLHISITALSPSEPWLQCNASVAGTNFGDSELTKLAPLGANLRWLDLAGTAVTDAGLAPLSGMPNLVRLHLERTSMTDAALLCLTNLSGLTYVNLYGTAVTDAGLDSLQKLTTLKQLYLWQTKVTPAAATNFAEARLDKAQIKRWEDQIAQLSEKIRNQHVSVDLGSSFPSAPAPQTNTAPLNASCPVSGKPVDPTKTVLHDGVLVAFCCDDCKAKFQQDPKPYLSKLVLNTKATEQTVKAK